MVCVHSKLGSQEIHSPLFESPDNRKEFFFVYWVTFLCLTELHRVICHRSCCFPAVSKTEACTSAPVTSIASDEDFLVGVRVVNYGEAFRTDDKGLYVVESALVVFGPREVGFGVFSC